jgi:hypothetical protein
LGVDAKSPDYVASDDNDMSATCSAKQMSLLQDTEPMDSLSNHPKSCITINRPSDGHLYHLISIAFKLASQQQYLKAIPTPSTFAPTHKASTILNKKVIG